MAALRGINFIFWRQSGQIRSVTGSVRRRLFAAMFTLPLRARPGRRDRRFSEGHTNCLTGPLKKLEKDRRIRATVKGLQ
jgi:hypothetical protein